MRQTSRTATDLATETPSTEPDRLPSQIDRKTVERWVYEGLQRLQCLLKKTVPEKNAIGKKNPGISIDFSAQGRSDTGGNTSTSGRTSCWQAITRPATGGSIVPCRIVSADSTHIAVLRTKPQRGPKLRRGTGREAEHVDHSDRSIRYFRIRHCGIAVIPHPRADVVVEWIFNIVSYPRNRVSAGRQ